MRAPVDRDGRVAVTLGGTLVALAVTALLIAAIRGNRGTSGADRVAKAYNTLELGPAFQLVAERRFGSDNCLLGECPRVGRYYTTMLDIADTCISIAPRLNTWAARVHQVEGPHSAGPSCAYQGTKGRLYLNVTIAANLTIESEPDSPTVEQPITEPHVSVVLVSLSDSK